MDLYLCRITIRHGSINYESIIISQPLNSLIRKFFVLFMYVFEKQNFFFLLFREWEFTNMNTELIATSYRK
ncbi:hypothetical protein C1645_793548 [Glomus cerebriforme]|uniref:Uncharacterized protein n=1 Tax=Glomus cerebriforme TaxID=658196 RepID=A0A397S5B0_9GLOM|nr:hypothetical protein C1645_793548 [Glomus cerebriforme]